jgi:hypothetical protein
MPEILIPVREASLKEASFRCSTASVVDADKAGATSTLGREEFLCLAHIHIVKNTLNQTPISINGLLDTLG